MKLQQKKLVLASASQTRKDMLNRAGIVFDVHAANIEENQILQKLQQKNESPEAIAGTLAREKAQQVSQQFPEALVIGADQILEIEGQILSKAPTKDAARVKLKKLRGKAHNLISSAAICLNGEILWQDTAQATLTMHDFSDAFLERYLDCAGEALTTAVGAYQIEGIGGWLFSEVEGDVFTILGMPLLPLLQYLRKNHNFAPVSA
jgi:septum formation protein